MKNINEAIKLLKNGYVLVSYIKNKKTLFKLKDNSVLILNDSSSYYLNINEFSELFYNQTFDIKEDDDNNDIDSKKDEEYYSYSGLKH